MTDIKSHADYEQANATFIAQKAAAEAAADEVGMTKAENNWLLAQLRMQNEVSSAASAQAAHEAAVAKIQAEFPNVPAAAYSHIPDVAKMTEVAEAISKTIPAPAADPPATPRRAPVTPTGDSSVTGSRDPREDPKYWEERGKVAKTNSASRDGRNAIDEIQRKIFDDHVVPSTSKFAKAVEEGKARSGRA